MRAYEVTIQVITDSNGNIYDDYDRLCAIVSALKQCAMISRDDGEVLIIADMTTIELLVGAWCQKEGLDDEQRSEILKTVKMVDYKP